ncbi:MAG: YitT family protein [Parafilimonas sp.]
MQLEKLESFILEKLHKELPHWLTYHGAHHTEEVIQNAIELGKAEGLSQDELLMLETAALLHDTGFLVTVKDHEEASCAMARQYLPLYDYSPAQIEEVCKIIMTTRLPQSPFDKSSQVLCDADLYYLGTNNYQLYAGRLYREMKHYAPNVSEKNWQQQQTTFLQQHEFYTSAAKNKLNALKNLNLRHVKKKHKKHQETHSEFRLSDILLMLVGALIAGFALKGFLLPNDFLDGGVTGISLLIHSVYHLNFSLVLVVVNIPLIILAVYSINKKFAVKTLISIICVSLFAHFLPYPVITTDKLLISIFGGFFAGVGMGLTIRAGSAMDGIEVLAVYTFKRSGFTMSEIILAINAIIFIIAASHFGIEKALYSMLTYFTATKTVDYVVEGIEAYTGVTIISGSSERIKEKLVNEMGKGVTVYKGERGFLPGKYEVHTEVDIIFTVITRLELRKLKNLVYAEDPKAFVFANTIKETAGGVIKQKSSH